MEVIALVLLVVLVLMLLVVLEISHKKTRDSVSNDWCNSGMDQRSIKNKESVGHSK